MVKFETVLNEWNTSLAKERDSFWWQLLISGNVKISHYLGFLKETYHSTRVNPQTQVFATRFFDPSEQRFVQKFLRHALEEVGHDRMAVDDMIALGVPEKVILISEPGPMTVSFSGLPIYLIQFKNPLCYLGHLFHLEFIATQNGSGFIEILKSAGVPENAMTFLSEHAHIDPRHNKMMQEYIEMLCKTSTDLDAVIYGATTACRAYSKMLEDACLIGEREFSSYDEPSQPLATLAAKRKVQLV